MHKGTRRKKVLKNSRVKKKKVHWNDHFLHRAKAAAETQVLAEISQIFLVGSEKVLDLEAPSSPKTGGNAWH